MSRRKPAPEYYVVKPTVGPRVIRRSDKYLGYGVIESRHPTYEDALNERTKNYLARSKEREAERQIKVRQRLNERLEKQTKVRRRLIAPVFQEWAKREGLI